jgi:hypothetical protein
MLALDTQLCSEDNYSMVNFRCALCLSSYQPVTVTQGFLHNRGSIHITLDYLCVFVVLSYMQSKL